MQRELLWKSFEDLKKAQKLLESSLKTYKPYEPSKEYGPEELEQYDALSFRFSKFVELCLNFFTLLEMYLFGEKSETLRDRLLRLERGGYIKDHELWIKARLLRNKLIHPYLPEELAELLDFVVKYSRELLEELKHVEARIKA